jgi:hypothetical protein
VLILIYGWIPISFQLPKVWRLMWRTAQQQEWSEFENGQRLQPLGGLISGRPPIISGVTIGYAIG